MKKDAQTVQVVPVVVYRWTTPRVTQDEVTRPGFRLPEDWDVDTVEDGDCLGNR